MNDWEIEELIDRTTIRKANSSGTNSEYFDKVLRALDSLQLLKHENNNEYQTQ